MDIDNLICIGQMAIFYVPEHKLDLEWDGIVVRNKIHRFLLDEYDAYTLEESNLQGFWRAHKQSKLFTDKNVRYEVSFSGRDRIPNFVKFLSHLCHSIKEEAIYLTMGYRSYIVTPHNPAWETE